MNYIVFAGKLYTPTTPAGRKYLISLGGQAVELTSEFVLPSGYRRAQLPQDYGKDAFVSVDHGVMQNIGKIEGWSIDKGWQVYGMIGDAPVFVKE